MKVERLLEILELLRPILERYRGATVEDMIRDVAVRCGVEPGAVVPQAARQGGPGAHAGISEGDDTGHGSDLPPGTESSKTGQPEVSLTSEGVEATAAGDKVGAARTKPAKRSCRRKKADFDLVAVLKRLEAMEPDEEMASYLKEYLKKNLLEVAEALGLKVYGKANVETLITNIISHYEQKRLPDRIARRTAVDDMVFMEEMRRKLGFDS